MYDISHTDFFSRDLPNYNNPNRQDREKKFHPKRGETGFKRGDFPKSYIS